LPGLVGSVVVVMPVVFSEDLSGVCFVEDQDVVADLVAEVDRSQCAFIFGVWGALVRTFMSSAWKTASKAAEYFVSRSRSRERNAFWPVPSLAVRLRPVVSSSPELAER
jgi:hypothetical protein